MTPRTDWAIAAIAKRQFGVISLSQLLAVGLSPNAVRKRVAAGKLHRIHKGIYAVGHARVEKKGRVLAAVLSCPEGTVASHRSAADLHGLRRWSGYAEVTVPAGAVRPRTGLLLHCCRGLRPQDITSMDGIPTTSLHRTIVDMCDLSPKRAMGEVIAKDPALIEALRRLLG